MGLVYLLFFSAQNIREYSGNIHMYARYLLDGNLKIGNESKSVGVKYIEGYKLLILLIKIPIKVIAKLVNPRRRIFSEDKNYSISYSKEKATLLISKSQILCKMAVDIVEKESLSSINKEFLKTSNLLNKNEVLCMKESVDMEEMFCIKESLFKCNNKIAMNKCLPCELLQQLLSKNQTNINIFGIYPFGFDSQGYLLLSFGLIEYINCLLCICFQLV